MLEWSYELLTEDERTMLNRLAVFFDGFELDDAAAVTGFDDHAATDLLDILAAKSLVDMSREVARRPCRRLLETVRLLALDQLIRTGEAEAIRRAHYERFAQRVEGPTVAQVQADTEEWGWIDSANFWAAIEWADENLARDESNAFAARSVGAIRALGCDAEMSRRFAGRLSERLDDYGSEDWAAIAHGFMLFSITGSTMLGTHEFLEAIAPRHGTGRRLPRHDPVPDRRLQTMAEINEHRFLERRSGVGK